MNKCASKELKDEKSKITILRKKDKILISFYIFLGITLIISLSYVDSTFGCNDFYTLAECEDPEHDPDERPFIQFTQTKLNEIKTESQFNVDIKKIFDVMADVSNYHLVLPKNIISVEIIEQESNVIIAREVLAESGIKTTVLAKHTIIPYNEHTIEILDGDAKGTRITQTFTGDEESTKISTKVELKLKGILKPMYFLPKQNFAHALGTVNSSFVEYTQILESEDVKIIDSIYRNLLLRPVDQESLGYWLDQLENELKTEDDIRTELLNSPEKKLLDWNSLTDDEKIMRISNENKTIIENLYIDILNRPVEKNGLASWGYLLENKLITEEEIMEQLYNSDEAISIRVTSDSEKAIQEKFEKIVNEIYIRALDREPTQEELKYYTELLLNRNMTTNEIYEELISKNQ